MQKHQDKKLQTLHNMQKKEMKNKWTEAGVNVRSKQRETD